MKSFIYCSDLHGDKQDYEATSELLKFTEEFKPDVRVFGGDLFDFSPLMRNADPAERNASMEADVEAGMEFLKNWKPHYFLLGNHDDRLWQTAQKHSIGLIRDTAKMGIRDIENICRAMKCKIFPYDVDKGILSLGKINFVHGFYHGVTATKRHAETFGKQGGAVVHGHIHSFQFASIPKMGGCTGISAGCLATTAMDWNRAKVNRLAHEAGWVYGFYSNKSWAIYPVRRFDGKFLWQ
jgi:UDP-2,3-diacylglucosamine pyrophosphatase LpxH